MRKFNEFGGTILLEFTHNSLGIEGPQKNMPDSIGIRHEIVLKLEALFNQHLFNSPVTHADN